MTGKGIFTIRLEQDIRKKVELLADRKKISRAAVITEILHDYFEQRSTSATPQATSSVAAVYMNPEAKKKLARKAHQANLTVPEYIDYLMEPKQQFNLNVIVNDLMRSYVRVARLQKDYSESFKAIFD